MFVFFILLPVLFILLNFFEFIDSAVSPCKYDLGSPLIQEVNFNRPKERVVVGIFSKNEECLDPSLPSIYTRLSAYYAWLQQTAGQQSSLTVGR